MVLPEPHVYGHDRLAGDERVAALLDVYAPFGIELGAYGLHLSGELGLGKAEVYIAQRHKVLIYVVRGGLYHLGQLGQYPLDLGGLLHYELLILVAQLHHGGGLDEKRRARAGLIVYEAGDVLAVLLLDGDDEAAVSYRHQRVLQVLRVRRGMDHVVELLAHLLVS